MGYDWQAELRQHLVRPNRDLSRGGQFSIRSGGTVTFQPNNFRVIYGGDAAYNIDVLEIFTLRAAQTRGTITSSSKGSGNNYFAWYTAAICDFHGILHDYRPPSNQRSQYADIHERVFAHLEEKYSDQPRPSVYRPSKGSRVENDLAKPLQTPLVVLAWLFIILWFCTVIMGHGGEGFLILGGLFVAIVLGLMLLVKLAALPAHLALPQRLARFVLLTMTNQQQPPPSPPGEPPGPPPEGPPPSGHPPLADGVWFGGLDEEPDPPSPTPAPTPPPSGLASAAYRQAPAEPPCAASTPAAQLPVVPVAESEVMATTPMSRLTERQQSILREIEAVVFLMDNAIQIPLLKRNIGIDPLLGLVWGAGDIVSLFPAAYIIVRAGTMGVPFHKLADMLRHVGFDAVLGIIPVAGQAMDFIVKANTKNLNIIYSHFGLPPYKKRR